MTTSERQRRINEARVSAHILSDTLTKASALCALGGEADVDFYLSLAGETMSALCHQWLTLHDRDCDDIADEVLG